MTTHLAIRATGTAVVLSVAALCFWPVIRGWVNLRTATRQTKVAYAWVALLLGAVLITIWSQR